MCCAGETPPGENWVKVVKVLGHSHARVIGGVRQHVGVVEKKTRSPENEIDRSINFFPCLRLLGLNMAHCWKCVWTVPPRCRNHCSV